MHDRYGRNERVAGLLRRELAVLIQRELKDPEIGFIGVSDVEVTRDLGQAKVFVTMFDPAHSARTLHALNRSAGWLRGRLGTLLHLRQIPELHFAHDDSVERGARIDRLLERSRIDDGVDGGGNE